MRRDHTLNDAAQPPEDSGPANASPPDDISAKPRPARGAPSFAAQLNAIVTADQKRVDRLIYAVTAIRK